jgi:hypothetical protein
MISKNLTLDQTRYAAPTRPVAFAPAPVLAPPPQRELFIRSDMADMVESIQRAQVGEPPIKPGTSALQQPTRKVAEVAKNGQDALKVGGTGLSAVPQGGSPNAPTTLAMNSHHHLHNDEGLISLLAGHIGLDTLETVAHTTVEQASSAAEVVNAGQTPDLLAAHSELTGNAASALSSGWQSAISAGSVGCGALGVAMLYVGGKQIHEGIKSKDKAKIFEGVNSTIIGARSGLSALTMSSLAVHSELLATVAHGAEAVLAPLGVIHGAIDIGLGVKDIIEGIKSHDTGLKIKGALDVGLGAALGVAALGGGLPFLVAASVLVVGKMVEHGIELRHSRAQELAEAGRSATSSAPNPSDATTA